MQPEPAKIAMAGRDTTSTNRRWQKATINHRMLRITSSPERRISVMLGLQNLRGMAGFVLAKTLHSKWSPDLGFSTRLGRILGSEEYQETKIMIFIL